MRRRTKAKPRNGVAVSKALTSDHSVAGHPSLHIPL